MQFQKKKCLIQTNEHLIFFFFLQSVLIKRNTELKKKQLLPNHSFYFQSNLSLEASLWNNTASTFFLLLDSMLFQIF